MFERLNIVIEFTLISLLIFSKMSYIYVNNFLIKDLEYKNCSEYTLPLSVFSYNL